MMPEIQIEKDCLGIGKAVKALSKFAGVVINPLLVVANAKAEKKARELLSDNTINSYNIPTPLNADELSIEERAEITQKNRNIVKQKNIETITGYACKELLGDSDVSPEPLNETWANHFFEMASNISEEEMQNIWGKILAGEIKRPNTYSLRTLVVLSNMNSNEAKLFKKISEYILICGDTYFLISESDVLKEYDVHHSELIIMDECDLLALNPILLCPVFNCKKSESIDYGNYSIILRKEKEDETCQIPIFSLTQVGTQIYNLFLKCRNKQYIFDLKNALETDDILVLSSDDIGISVEIEERNSINDEMMILTS